MATIPSSEEYERALRILSTRGIPNGQWCWLRAHYHADAFTLSTMELARVAEYGTHHGVNRHYGQFGADLAAKLNWPIPDGEPHASVFATFRGGDPDAPNTRWTLRPEVVAALNRLRWFPVRQ